MLIRYARSGKANADLRKFLLENAINPDIFGKKSGLISSSLKSIHFTQQ